MCTILFFFYSTSIYIPHNSTLYTLYNLSIFPFHSMNDVCTFCHLIMVPPWSQVCGAKLRDPSPQQGDVAQVLGHVKRCHSAVSQSWGPGSQDVSQPAPSENHLSRGGRGIQDTFPDLLSQWRWSSTCASFLSTAMFSRSAQLHHRVQHHPLLVRRSSML
jgi:hypothetical protein